MDKTETKEMEGELKPTDAGYKWFTCPTCDGTAKISQDQLEQINKDPLRSELQKAKEENEKLHKRIETDWYVVELRKDLEKAKELNGEFLLFANEMVTESNFPGCNFTIPSHWKTKLESLIKKSES